MIIEQHYDEEVLAEFLGEPGDAATRDKHLASCNLCQRTLASLRTTAQTLTEPAVWDKTSLSTAPRPETLAFLRGMQKSMADEDALAAVWIREDRKSTRLNSSHVEISYAVFCLKKKTTIPLCSTASHRRAGATSMSSSS